ncbi:hypothetical protein [Alteromonas flava]|uniref:hypothetical protein n=1 Tax=Alteromonas flava TaxID=2048003 RepID=UPI000F5F039D|nr:hypothetical protein [Alteromonas flava]
MFSLPVVNYMEETQTEKSTWLQRLKEQSWEAELLVSAIGTFASFQLFAVVKWLMFVMIDYLPPTQYFIGYIATYTGMLAVSMLTSMFILHFFLRFYWVGLVGLNSVFSETESKNSAFSEIYTVKMLAILPKVKDSIHKVDDQCSVIFSIAFCLMVIYAYFAALLGLFIVFYNVLEPYLPHWLLIMPAVFVVTTAIVQALVSVIANLKRFHADQRIQTLYFQVTRFQNWVFLGPFFTPVLQILMSFWSNFRNKKRLFLLQGGCFAIGLCSSVYFTVNSKVQYFLEEDYFADGTRVYTEFYAQNNAQAEFLIAPEIQAEILRKPVTTLFIPVFRHENRVSQPLCEESLQFREDASKREMKMACYQYYHAVLLNGHAITPNFKRMNHPQTGQAGIFAYLDLSEANAGDNMLTIRKELHAEDNMQWTIPFFLVDSNGFNGN